MNVVIGDGNNDATEPVLFVETIDCKGTTISRATSPARKNVTLLGTNFERSYPPKVRLPK